MLRKIFGAKKRPNNLPLGPIQSRALVKPGGPVKRRSLAVKIVHPGGHVERYYMAVPAQRIIEKYPSFIVARPDIFQRPWDSIVQPNEVLVPGQKYYIVPSKTIKKLRRRINKDRNLGFSYDSGSWEKSVPSLHDSFSINGILVKSRPTVRAQNFQVKFINVETSGPKSNSNQISISSIEKSRNEEETHSKQKPRIPRRTIGKLQNAWEPSLNSIIE